MKQTFPKKERLSGRRLIGLLFSKGKVFYLKPFRITWMRLPVEGASAVQILVSVPKYNFHKAVERNLIRRRMKEAYRLNKQFFHGKLTDHGYQIVFCITYTAKEIVAYDLIQSKIILLLQRLMEENEKVTG